MFFLKNVLVDYESCGLVENGLYTPMILWPIQLEKPSARSVAKPELAQCVSLNSLGVKNFG